MVDYHQNSDCLFVTNQSFHGNEEEINLGHSVYLKAIIKLSPTVSCFCL